MACKFTLFLSSVKSIIYNAGILNCVKIGRYCPIIQKCCPRTYGYCPAEVYANCCPDRKTCSLRYWHCLALQHTSVKPTYSTVLRVQAILLVNSAERRCGDGLAGWDTQVSRILPSQQVEAAPPATFSPLMNNISVRLEQALVSYFLEYMAAVQSKME